MNRIPEIVKEHVEDIIHGLRESHFFTDYDITEEYSIKVFTELLMEIYVSDPSMDVEDYFWSEDEFELILQKVITGSIMYQLKEDGLMDSYEDETTDETFFLTEKGKEYSKTLKK